MVHKKGTAVRTHRTYQPIIPNGKTQKEQTRPIELNHRSSPRVSAYSSGRHWLPKLSRPDPCSVDFRREAPKFFFFFCCGFWGGFYRPFFPKENPPKKKSTRKSPAKFTQSFGSEEFPSDVCRSFCLTNSRPQHFVQQKRCIYSAMHCDT